MHFYSYSSAKLHVIGLISKANARSKHLFLYTVLKC
jgi:hypothetical protein